MPLRRNHLLREINGVKIIFVEVFNILYKTGHVFISGIIFLGCLERFFVLSIHYSEELGVMQNLY